jgi:ribose transport system substrate-binding protein
MNRRLFLAALPLTVALVGCGPQKSENTGSGDRPTSSGGAVGKSASGEGSSKGALIGVSLTSRNHNFFLGMEQGVVDELKAQGYQPEIAVAEDSASNQQRDIDTFIQKGVKAIIMVPVDAQQAVTPVEAANKANIPILCIDRRVTDPKAKVAATIETDNVAMGEMTARYGLKLLCERRKLDPNKPEDVKKLKGKVVHLWGLEAASSAQDRAKGFEKVFNATATPGITIIKLVGNFNAKKAQEEMGPALRKDPDIELVFCHNDDNAIGALNAIIDVKGRREAPNDPKRIFIVGMDGNKPGIEKIRSGDIEATVSQEPIKMGQTTVAQMKKILESGKPDAEYIPVEHHLVTKKEADEMKGKLWSDQLKESK